MLARVREDNPSCPRLPPPCVWWRELYYRIVVFCVYSSHFLLPLKSTRVRQSHLAFASGLSFIIQRIKRKTHLCPVQMSVSSWRALSQRSLRKLSWWSYYKALYFGVRQRIKQMQRYAFLSPTDLDKRKTIGKKINGHWKQWQCIFSLILFYLPVS